MATTYKIKVSVSVDDLIPAMGFTPTEFDSADEKKKFLRNLCRWIEQGFPQQRFLGRKDLYHHLHLHMGHIAHYNRYGFFDVWFSTDPKRLNFVDYHQFGRGGGHYGDPRFTFSDVSRVFQLWLRANDVADQMRSLAFAGV
jgi:hypothetical protein